MKKEEEGNCSCSYPGCPRHADCRECVDYHSSRGEFTACFFSQKGEKLWDRSFECLCRDRKG